MEEILEDMEGICPPTWGRAVGTMLTNMNFLNLKKFTDLEVEGNFIFYCSYCLVLSYFLLLLDIFSVYYKIINQSINQFYFFNEGI